MSIRQGNKVIAGHINYHPDLFDHKWADHILNDVSWLRADTFSWQDGGVYQAAYNHLVDDISGKSLSSETISGVTVQFYLADDGHKICPDSQESNVASIFTATGVAWYYIIDTINQRFKLPRTNPDKAKVINSASVSVYGNGKILGLQDAQNMTGYLGMFGNSYNADNNNSRNISIKYGSSNTTPDAGQSISGSVPGTNKFIGVSQDATKSGLIGTADLASATSYFAGAKYLYFYVGNFTQTALENTAGLNASLFNGKADLDFSNTSMIDYVVEKQDPNSGNNYTWYRKYKSGWVEQGGYTLTNSNPRTVTFPVEMADTNYQVLANVKNGSDNAAVFTLQPRTLSTTGVVVYCTYSAYHGSGGAGEFFYWQVSGIAAN